MINIHNDNTKGTVSRTYGSSKHAEFCGANFYGTVITGSPPYSVQHWRNNSADTPSPFRKPEDLPLPYTKRSLGEVW
jgi:hypothetical protein